MLLLREQLRRSVTPREHALSIGVFDGVHGGHQMLIRRMMAEAATRHLATGVLTFHPSPVKVLRPDAPFYYLDSLEQRVEHLRALGTDDVTVLDFTSELAQVAARDFMSVLHEEARLRLLVVGEDFALGRGREGNVPRLTEIGAELGFEVIGVPLLAASEDRVSSTRVRGALAAGDMELVTELLTRPFTVRGPVVHGDARGRSIGFPTLNIGVAADRALPPNGVYVTRARLESGRVYAAATNIGVQPTFDGVQRRVETHLLDFEGDLYGQVVRIELLHRLRDELRFDGIEALVAQIATDVDAARDYFAVHPLDTRDRLDALEGAS
ncbi:MAG: bifunctional riboflavin kinase/FAD synthetase [Dehalococcoidia bacterium]|nr:bifunctional riboflavin kinase/FAD synthetase [Dehalococcoidia bacterium]